MDNNWAVENLQVIRTLMERSALYRRALAPIMLFAGVLGTAGGIAGYVTRVTTPKGFVVMWATVGLAALAGSFLMVRRQAMKDSEPFWSAPTRHVAQAMNPPLTAGALLGLFVIFGGDQFRSTEGLLVLVPAVWMVLYGCSLSAAGFFMRRGIRVLGWIFILIGAALAFGVLAGEIKTGSTCGHLAMGCTFGLLHVACGVYLYFTENNKAAE